MNIQREIEEQAFIQTVTHELHQQTRDTTEYVLEFRDLAIALLTRVGADTARVTLSRELTVRLAAITKRIADFSIDETERDVVTFKIAHKLLDSVSAQVHSRQLRQSLIRESDLSSADAI